MRILKQIASWPLGRKASWWLAVWAFALACATIPMDGQDSAAQPAVQAPASQGLPISFRPGTLKDQPISEGVRWKLPLGTHIYSRPTISQGHLLIGTNDARPDDARLKPTQGGMIWCLDQTTGSVQWKLRVPRRPSSKESGGFDDMDLGICSQPTVDGNRVYVVTNRGEVLCLDLNGQADGNDGVNDEGAYMAQANKPPISLEPGDGDIIWRFDLFTQVPCVPHDAANSSVLVDGDFLYVCTSNGIHRYFNKPTPTPDAPSLIVLDKRTGKMVAADDEKIGRRMFHGQWSSPSKGVVNGKMLIFFGAGDGVCYAFEAVRHEDVDTAQGEFFKLRKVWSFDCNPDSYKYWADGTPIDYWIGDASRAAVKVDFTGPSEIIATPVFRDNRVYVATGQDPIHGVARGILHCIDATGHGDISRSGIIWSFDQISRSMSSVAIADGLVYAADLAGKLYCVDDKTGKLLWMYHTSAETWTSPVVVDGKVYLGTQKGQLFTFRHGRQMELLGKTMLESPISVAPVVTPENTMLVASQQYLFNVFEPTHSERP